MKYLLELLHRLEVSYSEKTEDLCLPCWRDVAGGFRSISKRSRLYSTLFDTNHVYTQRPSLE